MGVRPWIPRARLVFPVLRRSSACARRGKVRCATAMARMCVHPSRFTLVGVNPGDGATLPFSVHWMNGTCPWVEGDSTQGHPRTGTRTAQQRSRKGDPHRASKLVCPHPKSSRSGPKGGTGESRKRKRKREKQHTPRLHWSAFSIPNNAVNKLDAMPGIGMSTGAMKFTSGSCTW